MSTETVSAAVSNDQDDDELNPLPDSELLMENLIALVSKPKEVRVEERVEGIKTTFIVSVAAEDRGKIIGKEGDTIAALRRILGSVAARRGKKNFIQVIEPGSEDRRQ